MVRSLILMSWISRYNAYLEIPAGTEKTFSKRTVDIFFSRELIKNKRKIGMSEFTLHLPVLSSRAWHSMQSLLHDYLRTYLLLCKKDAVIGKYLTPELMDVPVAPAPGGTSPIITTDNWRKQVQQTYHGLFHSKLFLGECQKDPNHLALSFLQTEYQILLCVNLLVSTTNQYLQQHNKSEFRFSINVDKAYRSYRDGTWESSFLAGEKDISIDERLYILSSMTISKMQYMLSSWYIDFFLLNKKKIQLEIAQVRRPKKESSGRMGGGGASSSLRPRSSTVTAATTGITGNSRSLRRKKILNIQLVG